LRGSGFSRHDVVYRAEGPDARASHEIAVDRWGDQGPGYAEKLGVFGVFAATKGTQEGIVAYRMGRVRAL
jgi:hypothetical protein